MDSSISLGMVTPIALVYIVFFTDVVQQILHEPKARISLMYVSILGVMSTAIAMGLFNPNCGCNMGVMGRRKATYRTLLRHVRHFGWRIYF